MPKKNTTGLKAVVAASGRTVDDNTGSKSDLKNTKVKVNKSKITSTSFFIPTG
ncbi:hypothetical protein HanRHA438_Chr10g0439681 [Helianthus annuus]|nr:hypothetical protein HanRHA438_Chr10g0439681 [Helianthus annuus]